MDPSNTDMAMLPVIRERFPPFESVGATRGDKRQRQVRAHWPTDYEIIAGMCFMPLSANHIKGFSGSSMQVMEQLVPITFALEKQVR